MTDEERLAWIDGGWESAAPSSGLPFFPSLHAEGQGCAAYGGRVRGGSPLRSAATRALTLRFADETLADLPLPRDSALEDITALPDDMVFTDGAFTYSVTFSDRLLSEDGQTLVHLAGTYPYTVDLSAKTVSLAVT